VSRGLKLIAEGALDENSVDELAARLGLGSRHLRRMFLQHLGATPIAVAQTRRVHFAKKLIDETELPMTQVAMASGFNSIRRFNATFQNLYGRTPGDLRRATSRERSARQPNGAEAGVYTFRLGYRPPYNWASMIGFLAPRAIPGVETITLDEYRRSISLDGNTGFISVRPVFAKHHMELRIEFPEPAALFRIVERVRNIFDLRADPADVDGHLRRDSRLKQFVHANAGMRVPGCWDGFEIGVRAILGQQVSVKGATTMAGRLVAEFGRNNFPAAEALADADLARIGLTKARANSIRELASAVARREISFDASLGLEAFEQAMIKLPGVGPWTAQYIAMRIGEPDAFPSGDLYLKSFAKESETWRPWRAYAAMYIWSGSHPI
jgi:AraC family transcriptional regulator of adaptative response / DNA-3-methyladenine glycosylase II